MNVELVPVIEITNYNQDIKSPDAGSFWKYPDEWENFNYLTNTKAVFNAKATIWH